MVDVSKHSLFFSALFPDSLVVATTPSEVHQGCLDEVQKISQATLFAPVLHCEAVQAMSEFRLVFEENILKILVQFSFRVGRTTAG